MTGIRSTGPFWITNLVFGLFSRKPEKKKVEDSCKPVERDTEAGVQNNTGKNTEEDIEFYYEMAVPEGHHMVKKGETLYRIANNYGVSVSELINANPDLEVDKNGNRVIKTGTFLKIPEINTSAADKTQQTGQTSQNPQSQDRIWGKWTIEKSKGAFSVMSKFNLYKEELQKLNPDINLDDIKLGTEFKVPGYEVKAGDSFETIAYEHDITAKMLKELNPGVKTLKAGAIINVPKKADDDLGLGELSIETEEYIAEETRTYTVKTGDTLYRIAKENNVPVWALMLANDIKDPKKLSQNQVLEIPAEEDLEELEKSRRALETKTSKKVKVAKNDNLSTIAQRHGVPVWAIAAKNNIENPNKLSVGQELEIPTKEEINTLRRTNARNRTTPKVQLKTVKKTNRKKTKDRNDYGMISPNMGLVTHRVKPRDTLTSIAEEYGVDVKDLVAYNNLKGKSLTIPLAKQKITNIKIVGNQEAVMKVTGVSKEFLNDLISLEKKRTELYNDGCGFLTIGIGHNTKAHKDVKKYIGRTIKDTEIYSLLARDILEAQSIAKKHLKEDFDKLSTKQKEAIYSLIFNTGGLNSSPKLLKAIKAGKHSLAAQQFDQVFGTVNGKKQVMPGLAKRRFVEISTYVKGSKLSNKELRHIMEKVQNIYDKGYANIKNKNSRVDYNAYAKKFLGDFIDKGYIKIKS